MLTRPRHASRPDALAILLLAVLLFRAYIPVGFMPADGAPFLVELCPAYAAGAPQHHGHHHHSRGPAEFQDCPFGTAPAWGPAAPLIAFHAALPITSRVAMPAGRGQLATQPLRTQQPRGPPSPV
jgi:hypothetical protein